MQERCLILLLYTHVCAYTWIHANLNMSCINIFCHNNTEYETAMFHCVTLNNLSLQGDSRGGGISVQSSFTVNLKSFMSHVWCFSFFVLAYWWNYPWLLSWFALYFFGFLTFKSFLVYSFNALISHLTSENEMLLM